MGGLPTDKFWPAVATDGATAMWVPAYRMYKVKALDFLTADPVGPPLNGEERHGCLYEDLGVEGGEFLRHSICPDYSTLPEVADHVLKPGNNLPSGAVGGMSLFAELKTRVKK